MISMENLSFSYNKVRVLEDISLRWNRGHLISIIGENGSGKSTLLKLLCRINRTEDGKININGEEINKLPLQERARLIAYIPQQIAMDSGITVYDFILLGRKPWFRWHETTDDRDRVFHIMNRFSIEHLALRKMGELSGGERQKALIARAMVQNTPVILLDEPTNNLDIRFQIELMEILKEESRKSNRLIIMAVHDINLALRYSSEVLMLKKGRIVSCGSVEDALNEKAIISTMSIGNDIIDHKGIRVMIPH